MWIIQRINEQKECRQSLKEKIKDESNGKDNLKPKKKTAVIEGINVKILGQRNPKNDGES